MSATPSTEPTTFLEYRLIRVAHLLNRRFESALKPHGLTARQFSVLAVLSANPESTSAELARTVLMTPQAMGPLIDHLEAASLIDRRERRGRGVAAPAQLSAHGELVLAEATRTVRALDDRTRSALGDGASALERSLERLEDHLRDESAPPQP